MANRQEYEVYELIDRSIIVKGKNKNEALKKAAKRKPEEWTERRLMGGANALSDYRSN